MSESLKERFILYYKQHEKRLEISFFIGGFIFDVLMVGEPDSVFEIIQQIFLLTIIASVLHYDLLFHLQKWQPSKRIENIWQYRDLLLTFLLGTLLNVYSIFYIKSASFFSSVIFLSIMIALILINEIPSVKKSQVSFKVGLFGICLFSFFSILYPILLGFVGWIPFGLALITTALFFYLQYWFVRRALGNINTALKAILVPGISVLIFFFIFYFLRWIPPVPLSVKEQGIYHLIEKKDGEYFLSTEKEWWKFWHAGDEEFKAQPGDKLYYYVQIYSPTRFSDEVVVHWLWKNKKGKWESADKIPMKIVGGRKEGFRGFTIKNNYDPGEWRVQVESLSGLEISRLYFEIEPVLTQEPREFKIVKR